MYFTQIFMFAILNIMQIKLGILLISVTEKIWNVSLLETIWSHFNFQQYICISPYLAKLPGTISSQCPPTHSSVSHKPHLGSSDLYWKPDTRVGRHFWVLGGNKAQANIKHGNQRSTDQIVSETRVKRHRRKLTAVEAEWENSRCPRASWIYGNSEQRQQTAAARPA